MNRLPVPARPRAAPAPAFETIMQVLNDVTKIANQVEQNEALRSQLASINGMRNLGNVFDSSTLKNCVPANDYNLVNAIDTGGDGGLTSTSKSLRDAQMVYNCMGRSGAARTDWQAMKVGLVRLHEFAELTPFVHRQWRSVGPKLVS